MLICMPKIVHLLFFYTYAVSTHTNALLHACSANSISFMGLCEITRFILKSHGFYGFKCIKRKNAECAISICLADSSHI